MNYIEQVKSHFFAKNGYYFKKEEMPGHDSTEVDFLLKAEIEDNLDCIERHLKIIKNVVLAFFIINVISIIVSFVAFLAVIN